MSLTLVLGGARSGKSSFAERLVTGTDRIYLATAEGRDAEMAARIADHQIARGAGWRTIEAPRLAAADLRDLDGAVLLDCLTLWLSNAMEVEADWMAEADALLDLLAKRTQDTVMVSNELGMGLVPDTSLGRRFRDAQGRLNQMAAARADRVVFVAAGLPLVLKGAL